MWMRERACKNPVMFITLNSILSQIKIIRMEFDMGKVFNEKKSHVIDL